MVRRVLVCLGVVALASLGLINGAGATTGPLSLFVPQGDAFAVLGHSCGGIQEVAFATGFDPTSGYPTGAVALQTKCGGSGRGGGYHTTTYSAWVAATWDFTATMISDSVLASAPSGLDPAFTAFDANGNEVYNSSGSAFVLLSPTFVPAPRVTGVTPAIGPAGGGTSVAITGTGFTAATDVEFGTTPAASFTVNSDTSITAVSPASDAGTVDITVTSAGGPSATSPADPFTFVAAPSVSGVSPNRGPIIGGIEVTVTGSGFTYANTVMFGDQQAGFFVNDDTSITAYLPAAEATDTVAVRVTSIGGTSAPNSADQFTYTGVPSAPTTVSALAGDGSAVVSWHAPANNGGAPIGGYDVTPYIAGIAQTPVSFASTATTETVTGLTNSSTYVFRVDAENDSGPGPLSLPSAALVVGAPAPPIGVRAVPASTTTTTGPLRVSFVAGANNGSAITSFTATCTSSNGGVTGTKTGTVSPLVVAGLTTGSTYTCRVRATNARGAGLPSVASLAMNVGAPAAPTAVTVATSAPGQVSVALTPGFNNGSAITGFTAICTSSNGGITATASRAASPITVTGLTPAKSYVCAATSTNARGTGPRSTPSPSFLS